MKKIIILVISLLFLILPMSWATGVVSCSREGMEEPVVADTMVPYYSITLDKGDYLVQVGMGSQDYYSRHRVRK